MNKLNYMVLGLALLVGYEIAGRSCDVTNILLQPGGYYAFPFKDTLIDCQSNCAEPWYQTLVNQACNTEQKKTNYYQDMVSNSCKKRFMVQALLYGCLADKGFNNNKKKVPLSDIVFSRPFKMQDINLASQLSAEGTLTLPFMPGTIPPFGSDKNEQYISLLAPSQVNIGCEQREVGLNVTGMYHVRVPWTQSLLGVVGLMVPIRQQAHRMTVDLDSGTLVSSEVPPSGVPGQTTLTQFFSQFESSQDFLQRGVIQAKGLEFNRWQRRTNIGDIVALTALDLGFCYEWIDALLVGVQWVFPTGNTQKENRVWPVELGNGGSYQFEPFVNLYAHGSSWINPMFYAGGRLSTQFTGVRRIPKLKSGTSDEFLSDTQLIIPPGFENYIVSPESSFSQFDTKVLQFADQAVRAKINPGNQFLFRVGNYIEDFLIECLDFGLFYDFYLQGKEKVTVVQPGVFDTNLLEKFSRTTQHLFSWRLGYTHNDVLEAYVGSQHVVAGKNVPQVNKMYASISAYF